MAPVFMRAKAKYRVQVPSHGGAYRTRTGPNCCNSGCASTRGKSARLSAVTKAPR